MSNILAQSLVGSMAAESFGLSVELAFSAAYGSDLAQGVGEETLSDASGTDELAVETFTVRQAPEVFAAHLVVSVDLNSFIRAAVQAKRRAEAAAVSSAGAGVESQGVNSSEKLSSVRAAKDHGDALRSKPALEAIVEPRDTAGNSDVAPDLPADDPIIAKDIERTFVKSSAIYNDRVVPAAVNLLAALHSLLPSTGVVHDAKSADESHEAALLPRWRLTKDEVSKEIAGREPAHAHPVARSSSGSAPSSGGAAVKSPESRNAESHDVTSAASIKRGQTSSSSRFTLSGIFRTPPSAVKVKDADVIRSADHVVDADRAGVSFNARTDGDPVRLHYALLDGHPVFAGWEETRARTDSADNSRARPIFTLEPLRAYEHGILGLVNPGGESAPERNIYESGEPSLGQRLADLIVAQLRMGPNSLEDDTARDAFIAFLGQDPRVPHGASVSKEEWRSLVEKAFSYALDQAPAFDARGLREFAAVHADAAATLGIDLQLYYKWKGVVGEIDLLEELGQGEVRRVWPAGGVDLKELLQNALRDEIAFRAAMRLGPADELAALPRSEEVALQWEVAGICMIDDPDERVAAAFDLIKSQAERGSMAAGRALALIVSHSEVNDAV